MSPQQAAPATAEEPNVVRLRGRLAAVAEVRELPSGDEIVTWRVIVPRASGDMRARRDGRRGVSIDTLDCSTWRTGVRRQMLSWQPDDLIEVEGALQRRYYRQAGNLVSRHEVVVRRVRRIGRSG
ncbi:MAG: single-stranded DNA-binding protein [Streptosporangiales bacterium]|nr:single-stranded DNA-binding protein [Streptosporangiales bacterium]